MYALLTFRKNRDSDHKNRYLFSIFIFLSYFLYNFNLIFPKFHEISQSQLSANTGFHFSVYFYQTRLNALLGLGAAGDEIHHLERVIQLDELSL